MSIIWFSQTDSNEKDEHELPFYPREGLSRPLFGKPKEIGRFSIDSERKVHFDNSQMKYLTTPFKTRNICLDLNVNFNDDVFHQYVTLEKMHQTLVWLLHTKKKISNFWRGLDFITVRGTLAKVTCTPYIQGCIQNQWEVCASKFKGIIYFSAIDSDVTLAENKNLTYRQAQYQSWGYKFEQYMTTDEIGGKPNMSSRTWQLEEYCIIVQNVLSSYSLLYKAEIDAVIPYRYPGPGSGDTSCYTELKTARVISSESEKYYFHRYKMLRWWAQSFIAGVPEIICGLRNNDGIVKDLEIFRISSLPEKAFGLWSSDACLNFCEKFLSFLKRIVEEDDPNIVYKFLYNGGEMIQCCKLINPSQRYQVIPDWYVEGIMEEF